MRRRSGKAPLGFLDCLHPFAVGSGPKSIQHPASDRGNIDRIMLVLHRAAGPSFESIGNKIEIGVDRLGF